MARWHDEFENHAVHAQLTLLNDTLDDLDPPESASAVEELQRVVQIIDAVREAMKRADPGLLRDRTTLLNAFLKMANNVQAQINAYLSNGNSDHIVQASNQAEVALAYLPQLSAAAPLPTASSGKQAASFRQKVGLYISELDSEADQTRKAFGGLASEIADAKSRLDQLTSQQGTALAQMNAKFEESQRSRITEFGKFQAEEIDKAAAAFDKERAEQAESHEGIQSLQEMRQEDQEEKLSKLLTDWETSRESAEDQASTSIQTLEDYLEQAQTLASTIASTGLSGRYLKVAKRDQWAAWILMFIGILAGVALAVGAGWLFFEKAPEVASVAESLRRSVLVALGSAVPVYLLREATERRNSAKAYTQLHVELASFALFLAELPEERRNDLREKAFKRFFQGRDGLPKPRKAKPYQPQAAAALTDIIDNGAEG